MQVSKRDTDVKNRLLDNVGEGEDGMISENSIETCILPYVIWMTSASSMHEAGDSKPVIRHNPEGWGVGVGRREGGVRGVQDGRTHVYVWLIHVDVCKTTTIT